ncbi:MAG: lipoprotein insertase outer membrane protein LolB [Legionellales bacterium]|nr:lipoprotein insertase outer membrane protein LolB [Legionellales bacterium]
MRLGLALILALCLSACAIIPASSEKTQQPMDWATREAQLQMLTAWRINGALGVVAPNNKGFNANYAWLQQNNRFTIELAGPLGANSVLLQGQPGAIYLKDNRGTFRADSPEVLLAEQMGWHLPISNLVYWVRGIPAPLNPGDQQFDRFGHLQTLQQDGWMIQYLAYTHVKGLDLPSRINLNNGNVRVKLIIHQWAMS